MKFKFTVLLVMAANCCLAANTTNVECDSYADDSYKGICIELPNYREIRGGSKIRTTYAKECPEELIGAFDYAVKIWEENLPTMLPLNITVKWGKIRGSNTLLSKVTYKTIESNTELDRQYLSPMAQIKTVALKEVHLQSTHRFYDVVDEVSDNMNSEDIIITYNSDLYPEFSFSIDDILSNKYDFVSLAIRDIAKGLGLGINITANNQKLIFPNTKKPFYESLIWSALENETPASAYSKCTQGSFNVASLPALYAPNPWMNGVSLQYFIPDETDPLSMLLAHNFGKGYVMRDLTGFNWENKFQYILDWQAEITTGGTTNSKNENGTTDNNITYKGNIDLSLVSGKSLKDIDDSILLTESEHPSNIMPTNTTSSYSELCKPYNFFYTGNLSRCQKF